MSDEERVPFYSSLITHHFLLPPHYFFMKLLTATICSLLLGLLLTPLVRKLAHLWGMVVQPRHDRWHNRPTALYGGVAIYFSFLIGCLVIAPQFSGVRLILLGGTLIFLLGLVDDFVSLKPYVKLVAQLVVAAIVVYFGRRLPWTNYEAVNIVITILWIVGVTNAVNLLDNMDGLAGGISLISCVFLSATFLLNGQMPQAILPAILGGAVLGFLVYNRHPATIFMGDCGSLLLGFVLSATALLSDYDRTRNLGVVLFAPMLILLIPIFDTCVVTVTRKLAGRPISQGGRDHTSHRLVALGLSEQRAVWLLYGLAIGAGVLAVLTRNMKAEVLFWIIPSISLMVLFLGLYLGRVRVYESEQLASGFTVPNVIADFAYKRRIFEILLDVMLVALAYYGAFLLRFDGGITGEQVRLCLETLPLVIAAQLLFLLLCGVYRGLWRYTGLSDLVTIAKAVLAGATAAGVTVFAFFDWKAAGLTLFVLYGLLLFVFVTVSRWSFRLLRALVVGSSPKHPDAHPVLIYGAGDRGVWLLAELRNNPSLRCAPLGFIDDDPHKTGRRIHDCRIYTRAELPDLLAKYQVTEVLISTPQISAEPIDELRKLGLQVSRLQIRLEHEPEMVASHI